MCNFFAQVFEELQFWGNLAKLVQRNADDGQRLVVGVFHTTIVAQLLKSIAVFENIPEVLVRILEFLALLLERHRDSVGFHLFN